jgi:hypothetical protein
VEGGVAIGCGFEPQYYLELFSAKILICMIAPLHSAVLFDTKTLFSFLRNTYAAFLLALHMNFNITEWNWTKVFEYFGKCG